MRKFISALIILVIFYTSGNINSQYLTSLKLNGSKTDTVLQKYKEIKSPELAGFLSLIVPGFGIGQIYNGQPEKALIHTSITVISFIIAAISLGGISFNVGGSTSHDKSWGVAPFLISFGVFTVNWIWSVVDAVISANDINKKARLKKYRAQKNHEINFRIGLGKNFRIKAASYF